MRKDTRNLARVLGNYCLFTAFTALGGCLFIRYPRNEALGGMILGLTTVILGLILPFHFWRTKSVAFTFFPAKHERWNVFVGTLIFSAILVFLYPSGILGNRATLNVLAQPPALVPALITFAFLLFSASIYALLFWGGLLHTLQKTSGALAAVIVTSLLFSLYHVAEFAFTPLTPDFFVMMFLSGLLCTTFTIMAKSVLPTLIAQQFGQFMHFVSLEENPFSDPAGLISNTALLVLGLGMYALLSKKNRQTMTSSQHYAYCHKRNIAK